MPKMLNRMNLRENRMSDDWSENLTLYFQRMLPLFSSLLLVFLSYVSLGIDGMSGIRPAMGMICVYFWLVHRPDIFNLGSVYFLGLIEDIISSAPFGSNVFALLVLYVLVSNLSRFFNGKPFIVIWYGFAMLSLIVFFGRWLLVSVYYSQFIPMFSVLFSYLFSVAVYPLLSLVNAFVQNTLMKDEG